MDAATKQAAYNTEASNLKTAMGIFGPINNLNLNALLTFDNPAAAKVEPEKTTDGDAGKSDLKGANDG